MWKEEVAHVITKFVFFVLFTVQVKTSYRFWFTPHEFYSQDFKGIIEKQIISTNKDNTENSALI